MSIVALIIDMQVDFFRHDRLSKNRARLTENINSLAAMLRKCGCRVCWIKTEFLPDLSDAFLEVRDAGTGPVVQGTAGASILPELKIAASDEVLIKKRYSAFHGTSLDELLSDSPTSHLIVAGINTHACIRSTVVDAYQRDMRVILAGDCIDSHDQAHHDISLRYMAGKLARLMGNAEIGSFVQSLDETARPSAR